jgi:SAM-dependent methyltransferase
MTTKICPLCKEKNSKIINLKIFKINHCKNCDIQFLDRKKDINNYFKKYSKFREKNSKLWKLRKIQYVIDSKHLQKYIIKGKILDVGCSTGDFIKKLSHNLDLDLIGIDPDNYAIKEAKTKSKKNTHFYCTDLINFKQKNKFDAIIFRGSFQFLGHDLNRTLNKISKISTKDSKLIIYSLPNSNSFLYHLLKDDWNLFDEAHKLIFNKKSITKLCKIFNYKIIEISYPYLETPYANLDKDYENLIKNMKNNEKQSFPFWGNIMQVVLEKK